MQQTKPQTTPLKKVAPNRQKIAGTSELTPINKKNKTKRKWPILEMALIILLAKIGLGAYYLWSGGTISQLPQDTMSMINAATQLATTKTVNEENQTIPKKNTSRLDEYLAVISPAIAQAAPNPNAISAISAGAMMVLASQNTTPQATIPLPPQATDLRKPSQTIRTIKQKQNVNQTQITETSLQTREQELARREELLTTREQALSGLETELNQRLATIENSRAELENLTKRNAAIVTEQKALKEEQKTEEQNRQDARLQHLVMAYGGMKPEQAGRLVNSLDEDVAVAILAAMPGRKAGQILGMVNADKAARLTKAISDQRIDPKLLLAEQTP